MGKWVILELEGDFDVAGFQASLEIRDDSDRQALKVKGFLPPAPEIAAHLHHHWQEVYRPLGSPSRIKGQKIIHKGSINQRLTDCHRSAQILCEQFRTWLNAESFQLVDRRLREELNRNDAIQFLIRTQDIALQKLPWHEWDFFERYSNAEAALSTPEYELAQISPKQSDSHPVRILAILGDSRGINVEADRRVLAQLPQAQVTFLVEPDRSQLNDRLWETQWDILFFAGHSETHQGQGLIYINQTDSLTVPELRFGLRKAIDQGLQLAIFNACDGLGLASALHQLHIPLMIVMREPVADQVAAAFLTYFLNAFASGEAFYLAVRQARERLQGLEHRFPCASWLPVIYQNPLVTPPDWLSLQGRRAHPPGLAGSTPPILTSAKPVGAFSKSSFPGFRPLWISLLVTIIILIVRHLGVLQPFELTAYDRLMRSRPAEAIDPRILVVEVNQADLNEMGGYPLSDAALAQTVEVLESFEPAAIGLDMHRYRPRGEGRQALLAKFNQHYNLFIVCAFDQVDRDYGPPSEFSAAQIRNQVGFSNFALDKPLLRFSQNRRSAASSSQEGCLVRRHLLSYTPKLASNQSPCSTPYSLSFRLAYEFLNQAGVEPLTVNDQNHWQLGTVVLRPLTNRFGGYQNLNGLSAQLMLNYRTTLPGQRVSLQQVLTGQIAAEQVRDRLVLVGYSAPVARDSVDTPHGEIPGVWVHAHMASQLLSAVLDHRPLISVLPQWRGLQWGDGAWLLAWSLLGGGLSTALNTRKTKLRRTRWLLMALAFATLSWGLFHLCVIALTQGLWLPLIPALLGVLITGGLVVIRGEVKTLS